jgi:hypothetical protein
MTIQAFLTSCRIKTNDAAKLQDEYAKLVEGLQESMDATEDTDTFMANPCASRHITDFLGSV